jgi:serine/threonine protein kinase
MKHIGNFYIKDQKYFAKGAFSKIFLGYNKYSNYKVAIKRIKVEDTNKLKPYVKREIELHSKLNHNNIVKMHDVIMDEFNSCIYLILEYCKLGDLSKFQNKRPINEIYVQNFIFQLKNALFYLKEKEIIHRDLKPQNLLITEGYTLKLSDFGLAKELKKEQAEIDLKQTYCGSPMYMSPELIQHKKYNSNTDLWSIGVILYEMITGEPPFKVKNYKELIKEMKKNIKLPSRFRKYISSECNYLLESLLNVDSKDRLNWDQFFDYEWLKSNKLIDFENMLITKPLDNSLINKVNSIFIEDELTSSIIQNINKDFINNDDNLFTVDFNYKLKLSNNEKNNISNQTDNHINNQTDSKLLYYNEKTSLNDILKNIKHNKKKKEHDKKNNRHNSLEDSDVKLSLNDLITGIDSDLDNDSRISNSSLNNSNNIYGVHDSNNSNENYTTCSEDSNNGSQLNSININKESSFRETLNSFTTNMKSSLNNLNKISDLKPQKFSLDSRLSLLESNRIGRRDKKEKSKLNKNITCEYVKVDVDAGNQVSFTSSLISSIEKSKPINIINNKNNQRNRYNKNYPDIYNSYNNNFRSNNINHYTRNNRSNSLNSNSKYDFHNEIENSVEEKFKKDSMSPSKSSIDNIFNSSINLLKESYNYLSNNKSL